MEHRKVYSTTSVCKKPLAVASSYVYPVTSIKTPV